MFFESNFLFHSLDSKRHPTQNAKHVHPTYSNFFHDCLSLPPTSYANFSLAPQSDISHDPIPHDIPANLSPSSPENAIPATRKSSGLKETPTYLHDYHCSLFTDSDTNPAAQSPKVPGILFLTSFLIILCPLTTKKFPSIFPQWLNQLAMKRDQSHTWELVPLLPHKRPIRCKWVFKLKLHADGTIERYKVRLVAKRFTQIAGIVYLETFSPIV